MWLRLKHECNWSAISIQMRTQLKRTCDLILIEIDYSKVIDLSPLKCGRDGCDSNIVRTWNVKWIESLLRCDHCQRMLATEMIPIYDTFHPVGEPSEVIWVWGSLEECGFSRRTLRTLVPSLILLTHSSQYLMLLRSSPSLTLTICPTTMSNI